MALAAIGVGVVWLALVFLGLCLLRGSSRASRMEEGLARGAAMGSDGLAETTMADGGPATGAVSSDSETSLTSYATFI
jgi:hypothetical protein